MKYKQYNVSEYPLEKNPVFRKGITKAYSFREYLNKDEILEIIKEYKEMPGSREYGKRPYLIEINGRLCKINSDRLRTFLKGTTCVKCGTEGLFFALEVGRGDTHPHLNFYTKTDGKYDLMTKDHIIPKSKGGPNELENYQPMCCKCNREKGNDMKEDDQNEG